MPNNWEGCVKAANRLADLACVLKGEGARQVFPTAVWAEIIASELDIPVYGHIHIEGRRWFHRGPGNTYHSVRIWKDGALIATLPYQYGYGDSFLQTALDWMKANGHAPEDAEYGTLYLREVLHGTYSCIDVGRKADL